MTRKKRKPGGERLVGVDADAAEEADEERLADREPVERERDEQHEEEERAHHVVDPRPELDPDGLRGGPDGEDAHRLDHGREDEDADQQTRVAAEVVHAVVERPHAAARAGARASSGRLRRSSGRAERAKKRKSSRIVPSTNAPSSHRYALTS